MARITTEDCTRFISNRFELVARAAKRARELANGARTTVDGDSAAGHKATVLALKEIATGNISEQPTEADIFEEFSLFENDALSDEDAIDAQLQGRSFGELQNQEIDNNQE